MMTHSPE